MRASVGMSVGRSVPGAAPAVCLHALRWLTHAYIHTTQRNTAPRSGLALKKHIDVGAGVIGAFGCASHAMHACLLALRWQIIKGSSNFPDHPLK